MIFGKTSLETDFTRMSWEESTLHDLAERELLKSQARLKDSIFPPRATRNPYFVAGMYNGVEDGYYLTYDGTRTESGYYKSWQWVLGAGYFTDKDENDAGLQLPHNFIIAESAELALLKSSKINIANSLFLGEINTNHREIDLGLLPQLQTCPRLGYVLRVNFRRSSAYSYTQEIRGFGVLERVKDEKEAIVKASQLPVTFLVTHPRVPIAMGRKQMELMAQWAGSELGTEPVYTDTPSIYSPGWDLYGDTQEDHWLIPLFQAYDKIVDGDYRRTWRSVLPDECICVEVEAVIGITQANRVVHVVDSQGTLLF